MKNIRTISQKLKTLNKKLYIVWGFCREKIMWLDNDWWDIDLVTDATPDEMKKVLKIVWDIWQKYWTCIVSEWDETFEITTFRKDIGTINNRKPAKVVFTDSLEKDSLRRDFTMNSIYFDVDTESFIDPNGGIKDTQNRVIRFVWEASDRLNEDALRLLRYVRLKYKYNLKDASKDYSEIFKKQVHLLNKLPVERLRQEFDKILIWNNNIEALQELKDIWFLKLFIPEVDILDTIPWNKWHLEWNVWIHIKMCMRELNKIIEKYSLLIKEGDRGWLILYYTILLHDIAKADTLTFDESWESHYFNHENIWAEIFKEKISNRLNFTNNQKKEIYWLIKNHIKLFLIPEMKKLKARKFMMHPLFEKLLIVWEADNRWRIPVKDWKIEQITSIYLEFKEILKHKKFLNGNDIMSRYPELEWRKIGERLMMLNDQILLEDGK